jgi:hypothetical protein
MDESIELLGLRAYAAMLNTLDVTWLEPLLADDFVYESQNVFKPIESKQAFLDYINPKMETLKRNNAVVFAELGIVSAYGREQPCVVLAQYSLENLVALVLAKCEGSKIKRLDLCIVPPPNTAERSGEYPRET